MEGATPLGPPPSALQPPLRDTVRDMVSIPFHSTKFWGPRVDHLQVPRPDDEFESEANSNSNALKPTLVGTIASLLDIDSASVERLCWFGAVHYCPVMPKPGGSGDAHWTVGREEILGARSRSQIRLGRDPRLSVPIRTLADCHVEPDGYIRVHCHPKRFPAALAVDWAGRIVAEGDGFVVMDKPPGIKVSSTVDNIRESLTACAAAAVHHSEPELLVRSMSDCLLSSTNNVWTSLLQLLFYSNYLLQLQCTYDVHISKLHRMYILFHRIE